MAMFGDHGAGGFAFSADHTSDPEFVVKNMRLSTVLAVGACLAFAGSASAAGMGGHGMGGHGMGGHGMGGHGMGGTHMAGNGGNRGWHGRGGRGFGYGAGFGLAGFGLGYGLGGYGDPGYDDYGYGGGYDPYYQGGVQYGYDYDDQAMQTGRSAAVGGNVCTTPIRSCHLSEPATVGHPCSCVSRSGTENGSVTP